MPQAVHTCSSKGSLRAMPKFCMARQSLRRSLSASQQRVLLRYTIGYAYRDWPLADSEGRTAGFKLCRTENIGFSLAHREARDFSKSRLFEVERGSGFDLTTVEVDL